MPESFESERLTIRGPRVRDAAEIHAAVVESREMLIPWMRWAQNEPNLEDGIRRLRKMRRHFLIGKPFTYNLFLKGTDTFVGMCGLAMVDMRVPKAELWYWTRKSFVGQGYMTEAVNAITDCMVKHLGARRIELHIDERNERSRRVAERCGFVLEGTLRAFTHAEDGSLEDTRIYAKVMSDVLGRTVNE